jgi:hypothetical protein
MRKRFEQQLRLGQIPISDAEINLKSRDSYVHLMRALKEIFLTPKYNEQIFSILEKKILSGKKATGRPGMDLWQIFVLAQARLGLNASYDRIHTLANSDTMLRTIMGIEMGIGFEKQQFEYQQIVDNLNLLDDETVKQLNDVIVSFGHGVFKKKEEEALCLKSDSFVVESNVHFPTDYNLLWDCGRKCLDMTRYLIAKSPNVNGWRKINDWERQLKNKMRSLGKAIASGGKGKEKRVKDAALEYLVKARSLSNKLTKGKGDIPINTEKELIWFLQLEVYLELLDKHIDLVERRIIKSEKIPHEEKIFSIFEIYTEWITKGKLHPNVELGKNVNITSDQFHLIVDYEIMEHEADSAIVIRLADTLLSKYRIDSWTFDKGFYSLATKQLLQFYVPQVVMPKRGKLNQYEKEAESQRTFMNKKKQHSAVESNINELEHRGLDRCPDRGYPNFRRYVGLGVCAFNLRKIGGRLIQQDREELQRFQQQRFNLKRA